MARTFDPKDLEAILEVTREYPEGVAIRDLQVLLEVSRRTLQGRVRHLVATGRLAVTGSGRGTRYRVGEAAPPPPETREEAELVLSEEAEDVREWVTQPIIERPAADHDPRWLEQYIPDDTFYLPEGLRAELAVAGRCARVSQKPGALVREMRERFTIDLAWSSSRIEGGRYSILETERLLKLGRHARGRTLSETQLVLNHKAAVDYLIDQAEELRISRRCLFDLHALLSENMLADDETAGRLRLVPAHVEGSSYRPPYIFEHLERAFELFCMRAESIEDPFEQSFFILVHLPYIHPFGDVNRRVARLAANIPLIRENLIPLSYLHLPAEEFRLGVLGVQELRRVELLRDAFRFAYLASANRYAGERRSLGSPDPFRLRYRDQLIELVREIIGGALAPDATEAATEAFALHNLPLGDRERFQKLVESELEGLHEGNLVRFRLKPVQLEAWVARRWASRTSRKVLRLTS